MVLAVTTGLLIVAAAPSAGIALEFPQRVRALGETRAALARAYDRLCAPPLDDVEFVLSDVHFHLTRRFTAYSGDVSGRMLGALQSAGPALGRDTPMVETLVEAFPGLQKPDGHFGADQDLAAEVNQARDMPILWGNGRLLLALAERCRETNDPELLAVATRIGDYAISTRPHYGKEENFTRVGGNYSSGYTTCYPSLIDGLVALGEVTGERRFYDEAKFIAELSLLDSAFEAHHSHGRLTAYRGMLDYDRLTGTKTFLDVVRAGCRTITDDLMLPTSGVTERFDRDGHRDEGCTEADWIRVNFLLWQATGETAYLDLAESALVNHLIATQSSNGGFGHHHWRALTDGEASYPGGRITNVGAEAYWCCSMHGTQVLADVATWGVLGSQGKVLVTWLAEVRSTLRLGDEVVTVTPTRVSPGRWNLLLDAPGPIDVTLRLRVPGWADAITVDGETHRGQDGWVEFQRTCNGSLAMKVEIPHEVRLAGAYGLKPTNGEPVRVFAGRDLYCLADVNVGREVPAPDTVPTVHLAAKAPVDGAIPVVVDLEEGRKLATKLVPIADRPAGGCRFLFNVKRVDGDAFEKLAASAEKPEAPGPMVELAFGCDGDVEVYLNGNKVYRRSGGWTEPSRVEAMAQPGRNVIALKVGSKAEVPAVIGRIGVGDDVHVTTADGFSAVRWTKQVTPAWLTDPTLGADGAVELIDRGGFGAEPWGHIPAVYAGTDARWIWPDRENPPGGVNWWLLRYAFDVAEGG